MSSKSRSAADKAPVAATIAGAETLTNKTFTTPVINGFTSDTSVINIGSGQVFKGTNGNVGIGTSAPEAAARLHVVGGRAYFNAPDEFTLRLINSGTTGGHIGTSAANTINFYTAAGTERARIDSSGNLLVGQSGSTLPGFENTTEGHCLRPNGQLFASSSGVSGFFNRNSNGAVLFFMRSGVQVGSISVSTTGTSYATSSDYRLKEDAQPVLNPIDRLMALKPINFAWKVDGSRVDGFLAHEAQAVVPEAITGTKDAVDAEGKPQYQGIDQSKLVPLLTAAIQEQQTLIQALTARIEALEAV